MATYKRPKDCYDLMKRMRGEGLTPAQRGVLLAQYSYADVDGKHSRPSEKTLAKDLGLSERQVRNHRAALRDKGWLIEKERGVNVGSGGESRASTYEVVIPTGSIVPVGQPEVSPEKAQLASGSKLPPTVLTEPTDGLRGRRVNGSRKNGRAKARQGTCAECCSADHTIEHCPSLAF